MNCGSQVIHNSLKKPRLDVNTTHQRYSRLSRGYSSAGGTAVSLPAFPGETKKADTAESELLNILTLTK